MGIVPLLEWKGSGKTVTSRPNHRVVQPLSQADWNRNVGKYNRRAGIGIMRVEALGAIDCDVASLRRRGLRCGRAVRAWQVESLRQEFLNLVITRADPCVRPCRVSRRIKVGFHPPQGRTCGCAPTYRNATNSKGGKTARKLYVSFNCTQSAFHSQRRTDSSSHKQGSQRFRS